MFGLWLFSVNLYYKYRVIQKSLRDFRPLRYSSRDGHAEGEHVNRGRDTPNFCPTLQVLDMFTLGDAADVNPIIKFLPHTCNVCGRNLITGPLAWPSRLLYRRGRKSRKDLRITLYIAWTFSVKVESDFSEYSPQSSAVEVEKSSMFQGN